MRLERKVRIRNGMAILKITNPLTGHSKAVADWEGTVNARTAEEQEGVWSGLATCLLTDKEKDLSEALEQCASEDFARAIFRGGSLDGERTRVGLSETGYPRCRITVKVSAERRLHTGTAGDCVAVYQRVDSPELNSNGNWVWPYKIVSYHASVTA